MRLPTRIVATTLLLTLVGPVAATADAGPGDNGNLLSPEEGNLLGPDGGNLLGEHAGNLLGEEMGNLLGESIGGPWGEVFEAVDGADGEAVAVVRAVRDEVWPG